jgi:hypothetical protein
MVMEKVVIRPLIAEGAYEGRFTAHHFGLLANPVPIYQSLLRNLSSDGATLESLKIEATSLAGANISCVLPSATVRLRIDKLEVQFPRLAVGADEKTLAILLKSWKILEEVEPTVSLSEHTMSFSSLGIIDGEFDYLRLSHRYLNPEVLKDVRTGLILYFAEDTKIGLRSGTISVDGFGGADAGYEKAARIRSNAVFNASQVPLDGIQKRFEDYLSGGLDRLGIVLQKKVEE